MPTLLLLTKVPLVELRSRRTKPPGVSMTRACRRDTVVWSTSTSLSARRPIVTGRPERGIALPLLGPPWTTRLTCALSTMYGSPTYQEGDSKPSPLPEFARRNCTQGNANLPLVFEYSEHGGGASKPPSDAERRQALYSTVTDLARFRGWSTSQPLRTAM